MRLTVFAKMVVMLVSLLIPILVLYTYANHTNTEMIVEEKKQSSLNQFTYFSAQVDKNIEQLSLYALTLLRDTSVLHYRNITDTTTQYEKNVIYLDILDKLSLYQSTNRWMNDISIYLPQSRLVLSTLSRLIVYDDRQMNLPDAGKWNVDDGRFTYVFTDNYQAGPVTIKPSTKYIMEISFDWNNIIGMMDDYKGTQGGEPFYYIADGSTLASRNANREFIRTVTGELPFADLQHEGNRTMIVNGKQYWVSYVHSKQMDGYFVNPVLLDNLLTPLHKSRNMFITSTLLLLLLSIGAALLLYRKVQVPVSRLMQGLHNIRKGDLSTRISVNHATDEFAYLTQSFNHMAAQIQELIEKVYQERIRSREATLKQLQSQINPHFLYNCLFYIKNMTMLGSKDAVVAMTLNLGEYYRYMTRTESDLATVEEEVNLLSNYLSIHQMRSNRMSYEISIPEELMDRSIPRLLIQPIVENAIIHGIEPKEGAGHIVITGAIRMRRVAEDSVITEYSILVQDDGVSLIDEELNKLRQDMEQPMGDEIGTGIRNVHQRLVTRYGRPAGVYFSTIPDGGLSVEMKWVEGEQTVDESDGRG